MGKPTQLTGQWRNRIVGHGVKAAGEFVANPLNWRVHPGPQADALVGVLSEVGWVQDVIENTVTGNLIDGHLRIMQALRLGDDTPVPYVQVELSPEEEATVLATLDPLSAMAATDKGKLDELLREVQSGEAAVQEMLAELAADQGLTKFDPMKEWQGMPEFEQEDTMPHRRLIVNFADEDAVQDFARIIGQGLTPKTKYVWHPEQKPERRSDRQYMSDES